MSVSAQQESLLDAEKWQKAKKNPQQKNAKVVVTAFPTFVSFSNTLFPKNIRDNKRKFNVPKHRIKNGRKRANTAPPPPLYPKQKKEFFCTIQPRNAEEKNETTVKKEEKVAGHILQFMRDGCHEGLTRTHSKVTKRRL